MRRFWIAGLMALALTAGLLPAMAFAAENTAEQNSDDLLNRIAATLDDSESTFDFADEDASASLMAATYPTQLDLRDRGVVTPVKFQNPWGTCWAFGIMAAAETSILSELGTTYEATGLDLSEHHLAWFAKNHIAAEGEEGYDSSNCQAGEGIWYKGQTEPVSANMNSGFAYYGSLAFASGMGAVDEKTVPYYGINQWVTVLKDGSGLRTKWTQMQALIEGYDSLCYSDEDDWTLPESERFQQTYALEEANILPSVTPTYDSETQTTTLNEDGINAIKEQLSEGKGVSVSFFADSSLPTDVTSSSKSHFINTTTWAHYTWSKYNSSVRTNHRVCIVGWDDTYSASNFTQEPGPVKWDSNNHIIYLKDGKECKNTASGAPLDPDTGMALNPSRLEIAREESSISTPPGDGAWIVKNSWGSIDQEFPNKGKGWGLNGEGYFYISYYDWSLSKAETFDLAATDEEQSEYDYSLCFEYDFLMTDVANSTATDEPASMANEFSTDRACQVNGLSCETAKPGTTVHYELYLLDADADDPTDGHLAATADATYEYGGYHRVGLSQPVTLGAGQRFSVVVTQTYEADGETKYAVNFNRGTSEQGATTSKDKEWLVGVVNPGESYLGTSGSNGIHWSDWADFTDNLRVINPDGAANYTYDNFNIKAYANPVDDVTSVFSDVEAGQWYTTSIQRVYGLGLMTGYKDAEGQPTAFGTHDVLTRAQAVAALYNLAGDGATVEGGKFSDVADGAWYAAAVNWAADQGIVSGYGDGTFAPDQQVTREQLAAMLYSMTKRGLIDAPVTYDERALDVFPDAGDVSSWATESMRWAVTQGVISGVERDGSRYLDPAASSERCAMAAMIGNILG